MTDPFVVMTTRDRSWLVWSNYHRAWWGPERAGYTREVAQAGRYTLAEALDCCRMRSRMEDGGPAEVVVPSPEWVSWALEEVP